MPDKRIECYKCGKELGIIRDALLYNDMYYVCGRCIRPQKESPAMPDFFNDFFGGTLGKASGSPSNRF
jgi:DNA-directed RNA polymerase subunit RPC12/RpoP